MYELLFKPGKIGNLEIGNRFVMPAMDSHYTTTEHQFTHQALNYYGERAKGGFGLIITEYLCVSEEGLAGKTQAGIYDDRLVPMLAALTDRIHSEGDLVFAQLHHAGRLQGAGATLLPAVGAGHITVPGKAERVHELTGEEIGEMIRKFVRAAERAKKAGFDGVEIHGAHGYLLAQFLSKGVNKRVDEYGGSITNRARIVCQLICAVKAACGTDFPVCVRTSGDEGYQGGNSIEDAAAQAMLFEAAGADAVHISCGDPIRPYYTKTAFNMENVKKVKSVLGIPVIGVGRINDPSQAVCALAAGCTDFVALGRQSICDPHFPEKVKEGRLGEIYTCTGCLQRCFYSDSFEEGEGTSCMMNPFSGKEGLWIVGPAEQKKRIGIVGAGPAGLQAAWILAKRGHQVKVFEKDKTAGGQYRLASVPSMKQDLAKTISTYLEFCKKYGAEVVYGIKADPEQLKREGFDSVILATGAVPVIPNIEGIEGGQVCLAQEVLKCEKQFTGKNLLILGAGLVGAETAEFLSEYGNHVTLVDMLSQAAPLAPKKVRDRLVRNLEGSGARFVFGSRVLKIKQDGIDYEKNGTIKQLSGYDGIILAFGARPNRELHELLTDFGGQVYCIGDALEAGDAKKAIYEATQLAMQL